MENVQEKIAGIESEIDFVTEGMEFLLNPEDSWDAYCDEQVDLSREWLRWRRRWVRRAVRQLLARRVGVMVVTVATNQLDHLKHLKHQGLKSSPKYF